MIRERWWNSWRKVTGLIVLVCFGLIDSCKEEPILPFTLLSLKAADGTDVLQGSPVVPVNSAIIAEFSADIDPATVTARSVTLTRDYDNTLVSLTMIVSRGGLSIRSSTDLLTGTTYTLYIAPTLKSSQGIEFASVTASFETPGAYVPGGVKAYWNFDDPNDPYRDSVGTFDLSSDSDHVDIALVAGRHAAAGKAASFNGTTSIIQYPSASSLLTTQFTISFWMKLESREHKTSAGKQKGSFVLGIGNKNGLEFDVDSAYSWCRFGQGYLLSDKKTTQQNDFQFFANGITTLSPGHIKGTGIENATIVNQDFGAAGIQARLDTVWAHVVMTFKDSTRTRALYINGELMYKQDLKLLSEVCMVPTNCPPYIDAALQPLANVISLKFIPDIVLPATYSDRLVFGFWQDTNSTYTAGGTAGIYTNPDANHFKGLLDDIRIFSKPLTDQEVVMMYNAEK